VYAPRRTAEAGRWAARGQRLRGMG